MAEDAKKKTKVTAKPAAKPAAKSKASGKAAKPAKKLAPAPALAPLAHDRIVLLIETNKLNSDQRDALAVLVNGTSEKSYTGNGVTVIELITDFLDFVREDSGPIFMAKAPRRTS